MDWYAESSVGVTARRSPPTSGMVVKLTPAEAEVASAAAQGLSNREIARRLKKKTGTVKNQLSAIYRKLAIKGRARLIVMFRP